MLVGCGTMVPEPALTYTSHPDHGSTWKALMGNPFPYHALPKYSKSRGLPFLQYEARDVITAGHWSIWTKRVTKEPMNKQLLILHDPEGVMSRGLRDVAKINP